MSRRLRTEFSGALWHITSRGVEKRNIFLDNRDRREFLSVLGRAVELNRWCLYAYVLMSNHYHLLLTTPEPTLSRGMQRLGSLYAEHFNRRYTRWGHLFGGRFKAHLVQSDNHLLTTARYVVLNPVRAGITATAAEWPWSSYAATAGLTRAPHWLAVDALLMRFHPTDRDTATSYYREFVCDEAGVRPLYGT
jgi:REP element-mobilizing transposase RayT